MTAAAPFRLAEASKPKEKQTRQIGLSFGGDRLGRTKIASISGHARLKADVELARKGVKLKKKKGRIAAKRTITLVRPAAHDTFREHFISWVESPEKRTLEVEIHETGATSEETVLKTWKLYGCWPKSWAVNGFDGKGNDVVTEEITFVVEETIEA